MIELLFSLSYFINNPLYFSKNRYSMLEKECINSNSQEKWILKKIGIEKYALCLNEDFERDPPKQKDLPGSVNAEIDIYIRNGGGSVEEFINFSKLISKYNVNLFVNDYCLSSCANYLSGISSEIHVEEGAFLGWHGGPKNAPLGPNSRKKQLDIGNKEFELLKNYPNRYNAIYRSSRILGCVRMNNLIPDDISGILWIPSRDEMYTIFGLSIVLNKKSRHLERSSVLIIEGAGLDNSLSYVWFEPYFECFQELVRRPIIEAPFALFQKQVEALTGYPVISA